MSARLDRPLYYSFFFMVLCLREQFLKELRFERNCRYL